MPSPTNQEQGVSGVKQHLFPFPLPSDSVSLPAWLPAPAITIAIVAFNELSCSEKKTYKKTLLFSFLVLIALLHTLSPSLSYSFAHLPLNYTFYHLHYPPGTIALFLIITVSDIQSL
jgi:hypothetical protein